MWVLWVGERSSVSVVRRGDVFGKGLELELDSSSSSSSSSS